MSEPAAGFDPARCPLCRRENDCALAGASAASPRTCWCASLRFPEGLLARVPADAAARACICRRCRSEAERASG
jgi:hypothetical protein